jgi:DNA ligase D-like protein (predicted 3'-phosphoesterase)
VPADSADSADSAEPVEPAGRPHPGGTERPAFVLHDHRRPRPHFDLRLEEDGVLRSWAVPRGLPTAPHENRLAVQVGDHALEHLTYEDADKSIADIGWWELVDRTERRTVFVLHGQRPPARYALIRTQKDWLLHRTKEQPPAIGDGGSQEGNPGEQRPGGPDGQSDADDQDE